MVNNYQNVVKTQKLSQVNLCNSGEHCIDISNWSENWYKSSLLLPNYKHFFYNFTEKNLVIFGNELNSSGSAKEDNEKI
jgi:hypothetical protein